MRALIPLSAVLLLPCASFGQLFGGSRSFPVGHGPSDVAAGDLNLDGIPDLVTADATANTISILLGEGDGGFAGATSLAVGREPTDVAITDLNGDHSPDVVTVDLLAGTLSILLGDGTGSFAPATSITTGFLPVGLAVGDLNEDGFPDLATTVGAPFGGAVQVFLGDGVGGFALARSFPAGVNPNSVALGDMNRDGFTDIVTANDRSSTISILLGDGTGSFAIPASFVTAANPVQVTVGDVNSDGMLDVAVGHFPVAMISVLLGDGLGGLGLPTAFPAGTVQSSVDIVDVDANGKPDIVTANQLSQNVSVLLGDGTGQFSAPAAFSTGGPSTGSVIADLDLDGRRDIAVTVDIPASGRVSVLYNQLAPSRGVVAYGTGTPGCAGKMVMQASSDAAVGNTAFGLTCTNVPIQSPGLLVLSPVQDLQGSDLVGLGTLFHVGLAPSWLLDFRSDAGGSAFAALPILEDERLRGLVTYAQGIWIARLADGDTCSNSPFGVVSSTGAEITIF